MSQVIQERRKALVEATENAARAAALESEVADLRGDLKRIEGRRDKLAAFGSKHVTIPLKSYHQGYGLEIEWEPMRSRLSGTELAAVQEERAVHLRDEIARREQEIERLLAE